MSYIWPNSSNSEISSFFSDAPTYMPDFSSLVFYFFLSWDINIHPKNHAQAICSEVDIQKGG